jgi:predicted RNase H-like HicB family nuclease
MREFLIVIEKAEHNFAAYSPDLPGCVATGKTRKATEKNMREAIQFHLDGMVEDGLPIPLSRATGAYVAMETPRKRAQANRKANGSVRTRRTAR